MFKTKKADARFQQAGKYFFFTREDKENIEKMAFGAFVIQKLNICKLKNILPTKFNIA